MKIVKITLILMILLVFIHNIVEGVGNRKVLVDKTQVTILSSIINAECGNCSEAEQFLVGSVVLNRTKHSSWPNTIESVVCEPNQFHGRLTYNYRPTHDTRQVAKALLEGLYITPDIYYFCLKNVTNLPMDTVIIEADYHYFGK